MEREMLEVVTVVSVGSALLLGCLVAALWSRVNDQEGRLKKLRDAFYGFTAEADRRAVTNQRAFMTLGLEWEPPASGGWRKPE